MDTSRSAGIVTAQQIVDPAQKDVQLSVSHRVSVSLSPKCPQQVIPKQSESMKKGHQSLVSFLKIHGVSGINTPS